MRYRDLVGKTIVFDHLLSVPAYDDPDSEVTLEGAYFIEEFCPYEPSNYCWEDCFRIVDAAAPDEIIYISPIEVEEGKLMEIVTTKIKDVKKGDEFWDNGKLFWTALADAKDYDQKMMFFGENIDDGPFAVDYYKSIAIEVRYADGALSTRVWNAMTEGNSETEIEVRREDVR